MELQTKQMLSDDNLHLSDSTVNEIARLTTATSMALCTTFSLERRALSLINNKDSSFKLFCSNNKPDSAVKWIKVSQIGCPVNDDLKSCFIALQNILHSITLPNTRILFLILGENGKFSIHLGVDFGNQYTNDVAEAAIKEFSSFCNIGWKGLKTSVIDETSPELRNFEKSGKYQRAYAFTGIPSLDIQSSNYPATMEYLIGGTQPHGNIAYLVVAEPVELSELDNILYTCDEIHGQAQSFEKFNLSNTVQRGNTDTFSESITDTISKNISNGESRKDLMKSLLVTSIGALGMMSFPPALVAAGFSKEIVGGMSMMGMGFLNSLVPTNTHTETTGESHGSTIGESHSLSESYSKALGQTLINGHVQSVIQSVKEQKQRYLQGKAKGMWRTGCYLFTDYDNVTSHLQLKSLLSGDSSHIEPIRVHDISNIVRQTHSHIDPFLNPPYLYVGTSRYEQVEHPFGKNQTTLTTYLTTEELTSMINFPLHSVPGISVVAPPPQFRLDAPVFGPDEQPIELGHLMYAGEVTSMPCQIPIDNLAKHALVCGVNGSGKTNSVLSVLDAMSSYDKNFMVVEPAKTEYVDWAIKFNQQLEADKAKGLRQDELPIIIYMPGKESYWYCGEDGKSQEYTLKDTLKLNPFEPVCLEGQEPKVQAHMDRIKSIFALAFPMEDILPTVLESLIRDVYTNCEHWIGRRKGEPEPELFPTLGLLSCRIKLVVASLGYEQRITSNIYAALNLRFGNLLAGWKRELLNNEVLGGYKQLSKDEIANHVKRPTWHDFFNRKVVINLSGVSDESDRTFVMGLLLLYLYEYRIALSESKDFHFNHNKLRHLMVIEEAHRVMTNNPNPDSAQYKCGVLFSNLLSEIRAYGQGIMVVDQIPTRLIPDAIKNTNLKIIHKTLASDDVEVLAEAMGISYDQRKIIPKLSVGQAIVAGLNSGNASNNSEEDVFWAKINQMKQ